MEARQAAEEVYKLAVKCEPIPEQLAQLAQPYVDEFRIRDPYNRSITLDGRTAPWPVWEGVDLPVLLEREGQER